MSISLILAAAAASHSIQIDHRGTPVEAIYTARPEIRQRTIGSSAPTRPEARRCLWTATIHVDRALAGKPALTRTIDSQHRLSGSEFGPCPNDMHRVEASVARRGGAIQAHLASIAEKDRPTVLAELDAMRALASN